MSLRSIVKDLYRIFSNDEGIFKRIEKEQSPSFFDLKNEDYNKDRFWSFRSGLSSGMPMQQKKGAVDEIQDIRKLYKTHCQQIKAFKKKLKR